MNYWGILMIIIGALITIGGTLESDFILYRILTARSRRLWGDRVHRFNQVSGILIIVFGILLTFDVFK